MTALKQGNGWFGNRQGKEKIAEIRNALASAEVLHRDSNLLSDQKEKLQRIMDETHRIANLLEES